MTTKLARPLAGMRVHFVGIGGCGMAALAEILLKLGYEVSGSDLKQSPAVTRLTQAGVRIVVGSHAASSAAGADHVVVSSAIPEDNPELVWAKHSEAGVLLRSELLGVLFNSGKGIAVAGTHGKTTTSSMLATILQNAGLDPTFLIGGDLNDAGSGARLGGGDLIVAEADEAFGSFFELRPSVAVITNVDVDHLDYYRDSASIDQAFVEFINSRKDEAIVNIADPGVGRIMDRLCGPIVTFGPSGADVELSDSRAVSFRGKEAGTLELELPGSHNRLNALGALAASLIVGVAPELALASLRNFKGVKRRFSILGVTSGVTVIDDYAHNPGKVTATVSGCREWRPTGSLLVLFQPHTYSRTLALAGEFREAFAQADVVVVTDVYGAREDPIPGVSGRLIVDSARRNSDANQVLIYCPLLDEAAGMIAGMATEGDTILTLGAGDVTTAGPAILKMLESRDET